MSCYYKKSHTSHYDAHILILYYECKRYQNQEDSKYSCWNMGLCNIYRNIQ